MLSFRSLQCRVVLPIALLVVAACAADDDASVPAVGGDTLSSWGLFDDVAAQRPADGVVPFDVIAPLYSDGADKLRFLFIPEGQTIGYDAQGEWDFPVGTILIKTFGQRLHEGDADAGTQYIETRLLVREAERWKPYTYIWNDSGTDAERKRTGELVPLSFRDADGAMRERTHVVPNENECRECHGTMERLNTLGGTTRMLDMDHDYGDGMENQLEHFAALGLFDRAPEPHAERTRLVDPFGDAPLSERARSYLDTNCGSCHRPDREASQSGFWLTYPLTDPDTQPEGHWGVCKVPTSAGGGTCGLTHDVVPGDPDASILMCRIESEDQEVMMPPLGRLLPDEAGIALLGEWIAAMPGACD